VKSPLDMGLNRSGLATAPLLAPRALEVRDLTHPSMEGDETLMALERLGYAREAEPIATMPPPGSLTELASTAMKMLKGEKATVLVDKVGERLAFERGGTRLYDALLSKYDAFGGWKGGPRRSELEHIRRQELEHFHALAQTLDELGADKTAVTPSADVHDVICGGLRQVLSDPSTNLMQGLEAILFAELADNDCWLNLTRLALAYDEIELARLCEQFLAEEDEHLLMVREWLAAGLSLEAFGDPHVLADVGSRRDNMSSGDIGPPTDVAPEFRSEPTPNERPRERKAASEQPAEKDRKPPRPSPAKKKDNGVKKSKKKR
jgi:rubrerythrin